MSTLYSNDIEEKPTVKLYTCINRRMQEHLHSDFSLKNTKTERQKHTVVQQHYWMKLITTHL